MTEWKPIIGYENEYLVSNNGDVFSLRSKKRLKPSINEKGYMRVCLQKRGMKSWKRVNRLVAEAFIPNPEDKPTVNHKNGIRDDNHVWNLEWATVLEQNSDPMRIKNMSKSMMRSEYVLRKKRKVLQFDSDGSIYAIHEGLHDAARSVGTTVGNIFLCCNGQRKTCKGFKFQYASYSSVCDAGDCGGDLQRTGPELLHQGEPNGFGGRKMRLIDADALIEKFNEKVNMAECLVDERTAERFATFCALSDAVEQMPTVDAVLVIRCKDCTFGHYIDHGHMHCLHPCGLTTNMTDDFCSYAERKE